MTKGNGEVPADAARFCFEKSNFFRVIRADGVWGGATHRGDIHMALFSEYPALPEYLEHVVRGNKLGEESRREQKREIVRQIEVMALLSLSTAIAVRDWLTVKIDELEKEIEKRGEE